MPTPTLTDTAPEVVKPTGNGSSEIRITVNDGKGGSTEVSFRLAFYRQIQDLRVEVMSDFVELYWDEYGGEGIKHLVVMNDEEVDPSTELSKFNKEDVLASR